MGERGIGAERSGERGGAKSGKIVMVIGPAADTTGGVMSLWWQSLSNASQIFWCIAIVASVFQLLMFVGSMFMGHDFDHSPHGGDGGSTEGLKLLSIRAITAFLVGFGWAGALFLGGGTSLVGATLLAILSGAIFMAIIFAMMRALVSLRADGTMDYANAIGQTGHVYVTIPARRGGQGQVEIMIQGRLATVPAITDYADALPPQSPIIVNTVEGKTLLVVAPQF